MFTKHKKSHYVVLIDTQDFFKNYNSKKLDK